MTVNPDELFEYMTGGKVDDDVVVQIIRELDDPESEASRMAAAVHAFSQRTMNIDWSQFSPPGVTEPDAHHALVESRNETYGAYLSRISWALCIKDCATELCAFAELEIERIHETPSLHTVETAEALETLANAMARLGLTDNAIRVYEHLVWVARQVRAPGSLELASLLCNVAVNLRALGELTKARSYFEEGLRIASTQLTPDDDELLLMRTNYGHLQANLGFFNLAAQEYTDICATMRSKERVDHLLLGDAENALGHVLQKSGDFRGAVQAYRQALASYENSKSPTLFERATVHCRLGSALLSVGDHVAAESQFEHARRLSAVDPVAYARTVRAYTSAYHDAELLLQAKAGYEEWLSLLDPSLANDTSIKVYVIAHIGCLALELNQNDEAHTYLRTAFELVSREYAAWGILANNLGLALLRLGELIEAERILTEASAAVPQKGIERLMVLTNLGNCRMQRKDFEGAADYFESAIAIGRSIESLEGKINLGIALNNFAAVKALSGDGHSAERLLDEAILLLERAPRRSGLYELARLNRHNVWKPNYVPGIMDAIGKRTLETAFA